MAGAQRAVGSGSGPPGGPSRRATGYAVAVLCLLLAARLSAVVTAGQLGQVPTRLRAPSLVTAEAR